MSLSVHIFYSNFLLVIKASQLFPFLYAMHYSARAAAQRYNGLMLQAINYFVPKIAGKWGKIVFKSLVEAKERIHKIWLLTPGP